MSTTIARQAADKVSGLDLTSFQVELKKVKTDDEDEEGEGENKNDNVLYTGRYSCLLKWYIFCSLNKTAYFFGFINRSCIAYCIMVNYSCPQTVMCHLYTINHA